jgi:hypothetical protein
MQYANTQATTIMRSDDENGEQWPKRRNRNENLQVKRTKWTQEEILRDNERHSSSRLSRIRDAQQATIDERDAETVTVQHEEAADRARQYRRRLRERRVNEHEANEEAETERPKEI